MKTHRFEQALPDRPVARNPNTSPATFYAAPYSGGSALLPLLFSELSDLKLQLQVTGVTADAVRYALGLACRMPHGVLRNASDAVGGMGSG